MQAFFKNSEHQLQHPPSALLSTMGLKFFRLFGLPGVKYFLLMLLLLPASFFDSISLFRSTENMTKPTKATQQGSSDFMKTISDDLAIDLRF